MTSDRKKLLLQRRLNTTAFLPTQEALYKELYVEDANLLQAVKANATYTSCVRQARTERAIELVAEIYTHYR